MWPSKITQQSGFTLLEILVALFIFAIMATIISTGLHTVIESKKSLEQHEQQLAQLQMAVAIINQDFNQFIDRGVLANDGRSWQQAIHGGPDNIHFTRSGHVNPMAQNKRSQLVRVAYRVQNRQLLREVWPVLDRAPNTAPDTIILLDNVDKLVIEYITTRQFPSSYWPPATAGSTMRSRNVPFPAVINLEFHTTNWGTMKLKFPIAAKAMYLRSGP